MGSSNHGRELPVEHDEGTITIEASIEADELVGKALYEAEDHQELDYLSSLRDVIRFAIADGFDEDTATNLGDPTVLPSGDEHESTRAGIQREKEAFEAAMELDTADMLQDEDGSEGE